MMEVLIHNWGVILIAVLVVAGLISYIAKDKKNAQKWLLYAVTEAEKQFGSKTGVLKLRFVYNWFIEIYPLLSKFVSFEEFSVMVDVALDEMRHFINTNTAIFDYVGGYEVEKKGGN